MAPGFLSSDPEDGDAQANDGRREGRYANYFIIGHNASEFVLDFGQQFSSKQEHIHSRVIVSPRSARELLNVLGESISTYERQFGIVGGLCETPLSEKSNQS
jgi:hypothetical protein